MHRSENSAYEKYRVLETWVRSHLKVIGNDRQIIYDLLLMFNSNYGSISHLIFQKILQP